MINREKEYIVEQLQEALEKAENNGRIYAEIRRPMVFGAIDLLKEQETYNTGKCRIFQCEKCGYGIEDIFLNNERDYPITPVYCPNCGRRVKQDA